MTLLKGMRPYLYLKTPLYQLNFKFQSKHKGINIYSSRVLLITHVEVLLQLTRVTKILWLFMSNVNLLCLNGYLYQNLDSGYALKSNLPNTFLVHVLL